MCNRHKLQDGVFITICWCITATSIISSNVCNSIFVYQKGDLVKDPMKSRDVVPINVPGMGSGGSLGVGWAIQG